MILKKSIYESVIMKGLPGFWGRETDLQFGFKGVKRIVWDVLILRVEIEVAAMR